MEERAGRVEEAGREKFEPISPTLRQHAARANRRLKEYNVKLATAESQVRELLNNATAEAEKIAASIKLRAQEEVEEIRERATKEIDAARKQATTEVYEQTANLATMMAEKILKRNLNADDQKSLVNESLEKLQQIG